MCACSVSIFCFVVSEFVTSLALRDSCRASRQRNASLETRARNASPESSLERNAGPSLEFATLETRQKNASLEFLTHERKASLEFVRKKWALPRRDWGRRGGCHALRGPEVTHVVPHAHHQMPGKIAICRLRHVSYERRHTRQNKALIEP